MTASSQLPADELVADVEALVSCESPSGDLAAVAKCADVVEALAVRRIGQAPERVLVDGRVHLRWQFGRPRVVLLGHFDTVWPLGTLARWPFQRDGDRLTGPGVFDMKVGVVQLFAALQSLDDLDGVAILLTSDEEVGSLSSQQLIEDTCRDARAVLVLEPSADGALKIARKGIAMYRIEIVGRAAHAGLEPESGVNATVEAAHQVLTVAGLARPEIGTTVTPTVLQSGSTVNTVPSSATLAVDVRAAISDELQRVEDELTSLVARLPGASVKAAAESVRPPLEPKASAQLFARAQRHAAALGFPVLGGVGVGGGSDGNLTAALGVPTLDGLGAVGANAHAEGEWASVSALVERTALVAALVRDLLEETR
ncbi:MAG TPA: M20 family metallopeptidase [Mycobacteriales bacterium]|nr:M20 family metallopeptidase [Mycobacteriales bacterium]